VRLASLAALAPLAAFTGFGFIFAPMVLLVLVLELWRAWPEGARARLACGAALIASASLCATFLVDYVLVSAVDCYAFPAPHPQRYLPYAGVVLARPLAIGERALRGEDGLSALPAPGSNAAGGEDRLPARAAARTLPRIVRRPLIDAGSLLRSVSP
jgi:hypothetical protein